MKIESWRFFFPAALMLGVAGLGLWALQLGGLWGAGLQPAQHGAFLIYGVMGTGIQGFLCTAYAKQNDAPLPGPWFLGGVGLLQVLAALSLLFGGMDWVAVVAGRTLGGDPPLGDRGGQARAGAPLAVDSGLYVASAGLL